MRFSWIALPLVFAALVSPASGAPDANGQSPETGKEVLADTEYAVSKVAPPLVALHSSEAVPKLRWLAVERRARGGQPPDMELDATEESAAREARLLGRMIDRAELGFSLELHRAVNGFLSSCTTSCPPPHH